MMPRVGALQQFRWGQLKTVSGYTSVPGGPGATSPTSDKESMDKQSDDGLLEKGRNFEQDYAPRPSIWRSKRFLVATHLVIFSLYLLILSLVVKSEPRCVKNEGLPYCM